MHFVEEGSDRQASTLLRMIAVAVSVLEREEEELKASEHEEEAGSARHSDTVAKDDGRLEEELYSERQVDEVGFFMQVWRESTASTVLPSAETTVGREVEPENAPELSHCSRKIYFYCIHFHVLYLYRKKMTGLPSMQLLHLVLRREKNMCLLSRMTSNFLPQCH